MPFKDGLNVSWLVEKWPYSVCDSLEVRKNHRTRMDSTLSICHFRDMNIYFLNIQREAVLDECNIYCEGQFHAIRKLIGFSTGVSYFLLSAVGWRLIYHA